MESHTIVFILRKDLKKSIMVRKKTKKIDKIFFVPKSIVLDRYDYQVERSLWKDVKYTVNRVALTLPRWYCKKELGFCR